MKVRIKGSYANWGPEVIYFCSNFKPDGWWLDDHDSMPADWKEQYEVRVNETVHMTERYKPPE